MTLDAMRRAIVQLHVDCPVQVDGIDIPPRFSWPCLAVVKGDATVPQIAAASIVAKVMRDRIMARLAVRFPGYGWKNNVGYGTPEHLAGLRRLGPTPYHRMSYAPVSQPDLQFCDAIEVEEIALQSK